MAIKGRKGVSAVLTAAMAAWLAACASTGGGAAPRVVDSAERERTLVRIVNDREFRMTVRVVTQLQSVILGSVASLDTATFEIPQAIVGPGRRLWFRADPIGGREVWVSGRIFVHQGDLVQWRIQGLASRR